MALFRFPIPALFTEAMSALPYRPEWEVETTLKTRYGDVVNLGYRDGDLFYVPRGMVADIGKDCRAEGDEVELECKIPPKNELQEGIIAKSWDLLSRGQSHILQAGTGTGKTFCALNLAARLKRRTLIVVTKDRMVQQWKDEITKFLGITQEQIGHIQQKKCTCKDKAITVAMLHSLATDKYADWVKEYFGLVIFDETHRLGSEYFSRVAGMYSAKLRLGLSATPKRSDGKEFVFMAHIGQVGVVADQTMLAPKVIPCATGFKLPLISKYDDLKKQWVKAPYPVQKGKLGRVNLFLAKHEERNNQIVNFVVQAYKKERHIVVFTALVEKHITPLKAMLVKAGIPSSDIGLFSRSAVPLTKLDEQKFKRVVLTTYGQCSEAIDVPSWDTAVLALPMANVKQIVGRVLREHDSKRPPVVFDLVDVHVPALVDYYHSRVKIYHNLGAHIVEK